MASKVEITPDQARAILATEEGHFSDLKSTDIRPAKLTGVGRGICQCGRRGTLHRYRDEQRRTVPEEDWRGFDNIEAANAHLQVLEEMRPLAGHYAATFMSCPGFSGYVLHVEIPKWRDILKASDGHPYVRKGAQKLRVDTPDALHRLRLDKGIISFRRRCSENRAAGRDQLCGHHQLHAQRHSDRRPGSLAVQTTTNCRRSVRPWLE